MSYSGDRQVPVDLDRRLLRGRSLRGIAWLRHGITARLDDATSEGNVGYGPPRDKQLAWQMRQAWSGAIGVSAERLVAVHQVHEAEVIMAEAPLGGQGARPGSALVGKADALVTNVPGLPLMTLHADCQPVLFVDPERKAVGVAHAGWRGVVSDVVGATVGAMQRGFGCQPSDLLVFQGPAIGKECYEVGPEVVSAWHAAYPSRLDHVVGEAANGRALFDINVANRLLLERAGISSDHIEASDICTRCEGDTWFSHRGQGPTTGRFAAIIAIHDEGAA